VGLFLFRKEKRWLGEGSVGNNTLNWPALKDDTYRQRKCEKSDENHRAPDGHFANTILKYSQVESTYP
jgi:hypothetical protein